MITVVAVGKSPPAWMADAYQTYHERLQSRYPTQLIEIPPYKHVNKDTRMHKEGEKILSHLSGAQVTIALDGSGRQLDSADFARFITQLREQAQHQTFVLGGSDGLSAEVLNKAQHVISLSKLTFTHYFARLILVEQIYRSWCIMNHHPYHK